MILPLAIFTIFVICVKLVVCSQILIFMENQSAVLSCSVNIQGVPNGYIFWYSPTSQTAACTCASIDNSVYCQCDNGNIQANYTNIQPTRSILTIQNVSIQDSGQWRCVLTSDNLNNTVKGTYDLLVIARPQEVACITNFTDNNSMLLVLCKTERIYPSAVCHFSMNNNLQNQTLIAYNHIRDANGYFVSTCYVKLPLLQLTPGPLNLSIEIYPNGSNSSYGRFPNMFIDLDYPDPVLIDCPSPKENVNQNYIKYGSKTTCTCRTNRTGNPPATTYWINSSNNSVLQINTTSIGAVYNCTVVNVFGQAVAIKSISYKPDIAYSAKVLMFAAFLDNTNATVIANGSLVTFKCKTDGNPRPVVTIGNKRKQYRPDSDGTVTTLMTCADGGVLFCNATNGISSDYVDYSNLTINDICPLRFRDTTDINNTYYITESKYFLHHINLFGYPAPTYFYIQKLNVTSKSFDTINFNQMNPYVAYAAEQKITLTYYYDDPPFGVLSISIQSMTVNDFTQYILYLTNDVTSDHQKYIFYLQENPSSSSDDVLIAAVVGTLSGVVVTAVVSVLIFKRDQISSLIRKHVSKGNNYTDNPTCSPDKPDNLNSTQDIVPCNAGYEQVDMVRTYDSLDQIQSEVSKYEHASIGQQGNYHNID